MCAYAVGETGARATNAGGPDYCAAGILRLPFFVGKCWLFDHGGLRLELLLEVFLVYIQLLLGLLC